MTRLFDDDAPSGGDSQWTPADGVRRIRHRETERTRTHHIVERDPSQPIYVDTDEDAMWGEHRRERAPGRRRPPIAAPLATDASAWDVDDGLEYGEPNDAASTRRRRGGAVDPLLVRVGVIVAAAVLATPVALALRDDPSDELATADASGESTTTTATEASVTSQETLSTALSRPAPRRSTTTAVAMSEKRTVTDDESDSTEPASVEATAAPTPTAAPACANEYEVVAGDYWVRLADASGAELGDLLAVNGASSDTALYPGDVICLPAGASTPAPPPAPTTQAPTTQAPTTQAPTTAEPTTQAPTTAEPTTDPPTTPAPTEPPTTPAPTEPPTTPAPTRPPTTTAAPPTTAAPTTAAPPPPPTDTEPPLGVWDRLAECESGGNWSINTGNGYYGGLQFSLGSWQAVGGSGYPHDHSRAEQIRRGEMLLDLQGWGAWPACSSKLGLR